MPTVPQYEPGRVAARPLNAPQVGVSASSAAFGARQAQAMGELGRGVFDFGMMLRARNEQEQAKKDTEAAGNLALQAEVELKQAMEQRILSKQGVDASNATEEAQKAAEEIRRKYAAGLKQGRQAEIFGAQFDHVSRQYLLGAVSHQTKQLEVATATRRAAENQTATERAVALRNDPAAISSAEETVRLNTAAEFKGMDPVAIEAETRNRLGALHGKIASGFFEDGKFDEADAYVRKNADTIGPEAAQKFSAAIKDRRIFSSMETMAEGGWGEDGIRGIVEEQEKDPRKVADYMQQARAMIDRRKDRQQLATKEAIEAGWRRVEETLDPKDIPQNIPYADRKRMLDAIQKAKTTGDGDPDLAKYQALMTATPEQRKAILSAPGAYSEARMALGGGKSPWWEALDKQLRDDLGGKVDKKQAEKVEGHMSVMQIGESVFRAAKIPDKDGARKAKFDLEFNREATEAQKAAGDKPLTPEQLSRIASRLIVSGKLYKASPVVEAAVGMTPTGMGLEYLGVPLRTQGRAVNAALGLTLPGRLAQRLLGEGNESEDAYAFEVGPGDPDWRPGK